MLANAGATLSVSTVCVPVGPTDDALSVTTYRVFGKRFVAVAWTGTSAVPDPTQLGADVWVNAYRSGDYVGRYLWRPEGCVFSYDTAGDEIAQPWRIDLYQGAIASVTDAPITRREFCIGAGAHTHYWDRTAPMIALELDRLIK